MKIQFKIALLFTLLSSLIIMALSAAVYYFAYEKAFQDFYTRLELRAAIAGKAALDADKKDLRAYERVRNEHLQRLLGEREYIVRLDSLRFLASGELNAQVPPAFINDILSHKNASFRKGDQFYKGIYYQSTRGNYAIILTAEHEYARNFLNSLKRILIMANLGSVVILFTMGVLFSRQILAPIRNMTRKVNQINVTSLHQRLKIKAGKDELSELGTTFNNMLGRLETSFETQNNFVSHASHELNTPLTIIIGEAEYALAKDRRPEEYRQGLEAIAVQSEKLRSLIKALLELAQSGFSKNLSFTEINIPVLLNEVKSVCSTIYPDTDLRIRSSVQQTNQQTLSVQGNFRLLELALSNLVLNACKYSAGRPVEVFLDKLESEVIISIKDHGIGIPEKDIPFIFETFFRASNVPDSNGYGIGLPLAQNILTLHSGTITLQSKEGKGTQVIVRIPRT